ncbi:MAG: methyltransferase [Patescibacteria group bacterium]
MSDSPWEKLIRHEQHLLEIGGLRIQVNDHVFTPDPSITYSSEMVREHLPDVRDMRVADIGTGTGILALSAAQNGAREVVATDVSSEAIENALRNVECNGYNETVTIMEADLLDGVGGEFDLILANLPMLDDVWEKEGVSVGSTAEKFLNQVPAKLSSNGQVLVPWGSFAEDARIKFETLLGDLDFEYSLESKEALGFTWYLYTISTS